MVAEEAAPQRQRLRRIPGDRNADEIAVADDAVGRIEIAPARARQIDLRPGMGRAAAAAVAGHENITADETRGQAKRADYIHYQQGEIAATTAPAPQHLVWVLHVFRSAAFVDEAILDGVFHAPQQLHRVGGFSRFEELQSPGI